AAFFYSFHRWRKPVATTCSYGTGPERRPTSSFRFHTGLSEALPTTADPGAFVAALNTTFLAAAGFSVVAMFFSLSRGKR
ncbi:MAG: hypothetical protein AAB154_01545, partial [Candidatus Binatota bacterium]